VGIVRAAQLFAIVLLVGTATATPASSQGALRYDAEYPFIGYGDAPSQNPVARLHERLERGELRLEYEAPRGYLDALLRALRIDPSSQTLVYSKTSLQTDLIRAGTPRAIYFNDDTYVAWVPATPFIEIVTMDGAKGPVFYTLQNTTSSAAGLERQTSRCLTCHDTFGMTGGGVPRLLFLSTLVDTNGETLTGRPGKDTTDQTPLEERWAGWYVTGQHGKQRHLGNILAPAGTDATQVQRLARGNIDSLSDLFDTQPYLTKQSDIVALLVLEHQTHIASLITRANFKSRRALAQTGASATDDWSALPAITQRGLTRLLEPLVQAMLFKDASPITDGIRSTSGFDRWFEAQGPRDSNGRSLRELDLKTQMFKHPLSYLVYSAAFDGLPACTQQYIYARFAEILSGRDQSDTYSYLSADARERTLAILRATKPAFDATFSGDPKVASLR
jgi:hypothetical protein